MYMYEITRILFGTVVFCLSEELHALLLLISVSLRSTAAIRLSSSLRLALTSSTSLLVFWTSLRICFNISEDDVCSLGGEAALFDVIRTWVGICAGAEDCEGKPLQKDNRLTANELVCSNVGVGGIMSGLLSKLPGEELPMESKSFISPSIFNTPTLSGTSRAIMHFDPHNIKCACVNISTMSECKKRKTEQHYLCSHCGHHLNEKSYKEHKRLYFSPTTKQWVRNEYLQSDTSSEDNLPSLPDSLSSDSEPQLESHCHLERDRSSSPLSLDSQTERTSVGQISSGQGMLPQSLL